VVLEISSRRGEINPEGPTAVFVIRDVTEKVRAEAVEKERARHLRTLVRAGLALTSSPDIEQILPEVVTAATRVVDGRSAVLRLVSDEGRLEIRAAHGMSAEYATKAAIDVAKSPVAGRALVSVQIVAVEDLALRPDIPLQQVLLEEGVRAMLTVPIATHGRGLGVFTVHKGVPYRFTDDEISAVTLLAEQTATALELARLFRESEAREALLAKQACELEAVNRELETFSYSVAHDLRAPLRGIDGFSQALLEDHGDRLDASGKDALQRVRAASQRMAQLIDDLLKLSRVTRSELHREPVDLSALARTIVADLQKAQPDREVIVVIAEGLAANGDPRLLRAVLENLLANAWKFTAKQPRARIEFGMTRHDGGRAYFVRDDGAGFDMAYADKLFGAFQRLHASSDFPGTGIGLATVQRIVHRHGGRVWAEGAVGRGATFYFTL
jgi:signal transduction histidine kinase